MAKSNSENPKIKPFLAKNHPQTDVATEEKPEPEPAEAAEAPPPKPRGRPKSNQSNPDTPKAVPFWTRVQNIDPADWGTRAKIKVYRLYPIINRLATQEHKFVAIYGSPDEPPLTENQLKIDQGSGKYRLYFNWKAPGSNEERELDKVEVSILDQDYPPKIPAGEWMDDPRNKTWAWAKPKEPGAQAAQPAFEQVTDLLRFGSELRREAREEIQSAAPPPAPAQPAQTQQAGIKEVFEAAAEVLKMRSDNPMVDTLTKQLDNMQTQLAKMQDKQQETVAQLYATQMKSLEDKIAAMTTQKAEPGQEKDWLDKLEEANEKKDRLAKVFGIDHGEGSGRGGKVTFTDRVFGFLEKLTESPAIGALGSAFAQRMMQMPMGPAPVQPGMAGNPANGTRPAQPINGNPATDFQAFIQTVTPPMISYLQTDSDGGMFAEWVHAGWPARCREMQKAQHPAMPGQIGVPVIIAFYKQSQYWQNIVAIDGGEQRFTKFIGEFCKWESDEDKHENIPEAETEDVPPSTSDDEERTELEV